MEWCSLGEGGDYYLMRRYRFFRHSTLTPARANSVDLFVDDMGMLSIIDDEGTISVFGSRVELHRINGLVRNFEPTADINTISALLFDPTAQSWLESHEYSNQGSAALTGAFLGAYVTKMDDPTIAFIAFENGSGVSGTVEPIWSTDGSTPIDDGTADRPIQWSPLDVYQLWAATTALTGVVIGNGYAWKSDGGGNSGGSEPIWPATPNALDTVTDGAITWEARGPCTVWAQSHRYSFVIDTPTPTTSYSQFYVIPTDVVPNTDYVFTGQPVGVYGTTGASEPDWSAAVDGDASTWFDGDIMWQEDSSFVSLGGAPKLVLTGIVASSNFATMSIANGSPPSSDTIILIEDEALAVNDYGDAAASNTGNGFDNFEVNWGVAAGQGNDIHYIDGAWTVVQSGSLV